MKKILNKQKYYIRPGYLIVDYKQFSVYGLLGSGMFLAVRDKSKKYSGCSFYLYPKNKNIIDFSVRYGNIAIVHLINKMLSLGSSIEELEAILIGGGIKYSDIGQQNTNVAKKFLSLKKIPIISEDTGGILGRKFIYDTETGESVTIKSTNIDYLSWYPYKRVYRRN